MGTKRDADSPKMGDDNKRQALYVSDSDEKDKSDICAKLQSDIEKIRGELKEGIGSLTTKMGELYFTNQQTVASLN